MSFNRIQKLLFSEYRDFEDMVLVESPFAQTTRDGEGVRQVHLGLTPTKLVLAVDVLPPADEVSIFCDPDIDPIIESLELIAIYPVECVNLSVFRRRKRQSLKAHFCNNHVSYFELGGFEKRTMFWNLWCERVKFLCPDDGKSIKSETSAATSTSYSTLQLVESNCKVTEKGKRQLWLKYGLGEDRSKYNFVNSIVGQAALEQGFEFIPEDENDHKITKEYKNTKSSSQFMIFNTDTSETKTNQCKLETSSENQSCATIYENENDMSTTTTSTGDIVIKLPNLNIENLEKVSESAVKEWEISKSNTLSKIEVTRGRHPRRYAFSPQPHFLNGLGPWNLHSGDRYSVQMKRSVSSARIRRQPSEADLCLPISKRLLTVSISCEAFHMDCGANISGAANKLMTPEKPLLYFWTPEYWYRPQPARDAYLEFVLHKNKIRTYLDCKKSKKKRLNLKRQLIEDAREFEKIFVNSQNFSKFANDNPNGANPAQHMTTVQVLRQILKMNVALRAWDFDSTTLAYQLTMTDKELFLKITELELGAVVWHHNSKNMPNIGSIIAFSHRISCLVATEILREEQVGMRARLIVRFISVASKCERLNNYQSCVSVLNGLQSPPIYRLHHTWAHLRKYHSMKYLLFETLCRQCSDARLPHYQKIFYIASRKPPFLPYIGDILTKLLGKSFNLTEDEFREYEENINYSVLQDNIKDFNRLLALRMEETKMNNTNITKSSSRISRTNLPSKKTNKIINFFSNIKMWKSNNVTYKKTKQYPKQKNDKTKRVNRAPNKRRCQTNHHECMHSKEDRLQCLADTTRYIQAGQKAATKYALSTDDLAREYLLKARYREEKENFFNSFKLEPKITYKCNINPSLVS